jgi:hypothetical protein
LEQVTGQSKRSRIKGIRQNRKEEREMEREAQAWQLGETAHSDHSGKVIPLIVPTEDSESDQDAEEPQHEVLAAESVDNQEESMV